MATEITIPKLGLTMEEGLIEEWLVEAGTAVKVGDPLMRMGTDKVDVDVEAEDEGIFHPAVAAGTSLPPGAVFGWLLAPGESVPTGGAVSDGSSAPDETEELLATTAVPLVEVAGPAASNGSGPSAGRHSQNGRLFVSPNARRVAKEKNVDVTTLRGSGPNGRIITADVLEAPASVAVAPTPPSTTSPLVRRDAAAKGVDLGAVSGTGPGGKVRRADLAGATPATVISGAPSLAAQVIPLTGMRGVIASRMHASLQEMAQLTLGTDTSMDAVVALRAQLKSEWAEAGLTVPSINDFVIRAVALTLREHPRLNAMIKDNAIHVQPDINVGVAVALDEGLIVPVVQHADQLTLSQLAVESRRLALGARSGGLGLPDLEGGTFTVSTLGNFGIDFFTPVISPGQVGILGVGRLRDSVRWEGDVPKRTQIITLSITFDHRAVDGAPAAEFVRDVGVRLANPLRLLA